MKEIVEQEIVETFEITIQPQFPPSQDLDLIEEKFRQADADLASVVDQSNKLWQLRQDEENRRLEEERVFREQQRILLERKFLED